MRIHFIAIGGAAMHNLAMAVSEKEGYIVTGSDDEIFDPALTHLERKGLLPKELGWYPERITPDLDAVILGMHAREDNPELLRAKELNIPIFSFPQYLYEQTKNKTRIVVGGSHGKTTTTAMILYVLQQLGIETDYMVGAQIEGFDNMVHLQGSEVSNFANLSTVNHQLSTGLAVFEGDEYLTSPLDRRSKFHLYHPHIAILTGIAWDHINVFPTFEQYVDTFRQFVDLIEPNGTLIYYAGDENLCKIASQARQDIHCIPYKELPYRVENGQTIIQVKQASRLPNQGEEASRRLKDYPIQIFGTHNLQNLHAADLALQAIGIDEDAILTAIQSFTGASNRLEKVAETATSVAYKDFAHSPSKLKATIHAVREQYPDKRLVAAMELHTFSSLTADFLPQYKDCMQEADVAFVYFNPKVIEHKHLTPITAAQVAAAFGGNVQVFTDSQALQKELQSLDYQHTALLLMTSGTFDGVNLKAFATELLNK